MGGVFSAFGLSRAEFSNTEDCPSSGFFSEALLALWDFLLNVLFSLLFAFLIIASGLLWALWGALSSCLVSALAVVAHGQGMLVCLLWQQLSWKCLQFLDGLMWKFKIIPKICCRILAYFFLLRSWKNEARILQIFGIFEIFSSTYEKLVFNANQILIWVSCLSSKINRS